MRLALRKPVQPFPVFATLLSLETRIPAARALYHLEPTGSGTRLSQIDDIDWKISKLAFPIARMMVSRDMARQLASLKRTLEGA